MTKPAKPAKKAKPKSKSARSVRTARFHIRINQFSGLSRPYLRAANGEYVGGSESYNTITGAKKWIESLSAWVAEASKQETIIDEE